MEIYDKFLQFLCTEHPGVSDLTLRWLNRSQSARAVVHARSRLHRHPFPDDFKERKDWVDFTRYLIPDRPDELSAVELDTFSQIYPKDGEPLRFRASLSRNIFGEELVLRVLPSQIPSPEDILIPQRLVNDFLALKEGLVIVSGATGSGKSTTIASLVKARAERIPQKIISLEDPVEYVYPETVGDSDFSQRQVGDDTRSFAAGLKAALRMRPDIIVVGEIRDPASAATALMAGMSGHIVVGTLHSAFAFQAPQRLFAYIDNDESGMSGSGGLEVISTTLKLVVAQRLFPHPATRKPVAIHEILKLTDAVSQKIQQGEFKSLKLELETGSTYGMQTFNQAIRKRVESGLLPPECLAPEE
jgi:twitching motility protein PilT